MTKKPAVDDPIEAVALLEEPNRQRLYDLVAASHEPVGRDDAAAAALGISRELAAFHLDRLVEAGLLETEYRRRSGRTGPGAGRPAKLYRRADREVAISLPPRHYDLAADLMATALDRLGGGSGAEAVAAVARERGTKVGVEARRNAGARPGRRRLLTALLDVLRGAGYEPEIETPTGTVCLRNCPYDALASDHRELTCGMNLAWAEGVVDGLGSPVSVELAPEPGHCCVVFHPALGWTRRRWTPAPNEPQHEKGVGTTMCLNCGCMRAHDDMGKPGINITYEDVKRAADANAMTVDATLAMIARTSDKDRGDHPAEYSRAGRCSCPYSSGAVGRLARRAGHLVRRGSSPSPSSSCRSFCSSASRPSCGPSRSIMRTWAGLPA